MCARRAARVRVPRAARVFARYDGRMHGPLAASVVDALPDSVLTIDRSSTIVAANRAALALFGYAADEFVGRSLV